MSEPTGEQIIKRRFGPAFDKPCVRPDVIECAMWECQFKDECQYADRTAAERAKPAASDIENEIADILEGSGLHPAKVSQLCRLYLAGIDIARREGEIAMRERALDALWQHCNDATDACAVVRALPAT